MGAGDGWAGGCQAGWSKQRMGEEEGHIPDVFVGTGRPGRSKVRLGSRILIILPRPTSDLLNPVAV